MLHLARILLLSLTCGYAALGPSAHAEVASTWAESHRSRVRVIVGEAKPNERWAGVEIALDPGFKTYWRSPGESGLPPSFDWSRSVNAEAVEVLWPAPARMEDEGGVSYGYAGGVVLPVRVTPRDPDKPVRLALTIDYGVCKDICIPAQARAGADLAVGAAAPSAALVARARARVPKPQALGAEGELSVLDVTPMADGGKPRVKVAVRAPAGAAPRLFVEGPDDWFFAAPGAMTPDAEHAAGATGTYLVEVDPPSNAATGPLPLRLTLVAGDRAIETTASLEASRLSR